MTRSSLNGMTYNISEERSPRDVTMNKLNLKKIYIEPTTSCNLSCTTCMRETWDEPGGQMSMEAFNNFIDGIKDIETLEKVAIWGIGEPLTHPHIAEMISAVKKLNLETELITNAMRLNESMAKKLIEAGLDRIVISIDSTTEEQLSEIRTGAKLSNIVSNIKKLNQLKLVLRKSNPEVGMEFIVMKKNMAELKNLREFAQTIEASFIIVSNVLPYSEEYKDEILYSLSATDNYTKSRSKYDPEIMLPKIDVREENINHLGKISFEALSFGPEPAVTKNYKGVCPFVEKGSLAISWNGEVSPCVPLMHTYTCYVLGKEKKFHKFSFGNMNAEKPLGIWNKPDYKDFRKRIMEGLFSPCIECGGCDLSESNLEDCYGNLHPTCGDCLWAKGVIQCP